MLPPADYVGARADITEGAQSVRLWSRLAWLDVKRRYRRTVLGPLWVTISFAFLAGAMGFIWAPLFGVDVSDYLPFVTSGIVCWSLLATIITDGAQVYTGYDNLLKSLRLPLTTLNLVSVWRSVIVFLHNLVIVVIVNVVTSTPLTWATLLIIPGMALLALNGVWISMLIGIISTRFRDIPPLITNVMQVMYFITPVFWFPDQLTGPRALVVHYNYLFHLMDMVRSPMLGQAPSLLSYQVVLAVTALGLAGTYLIFARFRRRITYWL